MIRRATTLERRIAKLEGGTGPLSPAERAELAEFDRWFDETFLRPIAEWSDDQLAQYFQHARGYDGLAQRYDELRHHDQSPERKDADHRRLAKHLGIAPSEVEGYLARAIAALTGTGGTP
jgi:hypothetical protein